MFWIFEGRFFHEYVNMFLCFRHHMLEFKSIRIMHLFDFLTWWSSSESAQTRVNSIDSTNGKQPQMVFTRGAKMMVLSCFFLQMEFTTLAIWWLYITQVLRAQKGRSKPHQHQRNNKMQQEAMWRNVSYEKNPPTFHYTGWFIGILILAHQNPHIIG